MGFQRVLPKACGRGPRQVDLTLNSSASFGPGLDRLIPPEITDDAFARIIEEIAATPGVREILEIGSSAGEGSTAAWVRGALRNSRRPRLHCIEASTERYAALVEQWGDQDFVRCHHVSSIPVERLASAAEVEQFYRDVPSRLRDFELTVVLGWLQQDIDYLRDNGLSSPGIAQIKESYGVGTFDAVLIDGSEFAGRAELEEVYGARYLLLDDTETFKNWQTSRSLQADPELLPYPCRPACAEWIRRLRAHRVSERLRSTAPNVMRSTMGGLVALVVHALRARLRTRAAAASVASGRSP